MERKQGMSAAAAVHVSLGVVTYLFKSEIGMILSASADSHGSSGTSFSTSERTMTNPDPGSKTTPPRPLPEDKDD